MQVADFSIEDCFVPRNDVVLMCVLLGRCW